MRKLFVLIMSIVLLVSCKENKNAEGVLSPYISILDLRGLYKGEDLVLTRQNMKSGAHLIRGVVISDRSIVNRKQNTLIIQGKQKDVTRGIALEVDDSYAASYGLGDSVLVDVENGVLRKVNGGLIVTGVNPGNIIKKGTVGIEPMEVSVKSIVEAPDAYEYTLVKIPACVVDNEQDADGVFSGDKSFSDATGVSLSVHVEPESSLAQLSVPYSATFTGIPIIYRGQEAESIRLWIRDKDDIKDPSGPIYASFPEDFEMGVLTSYSATEKVVALKTGDWGFTYGILGTSPNDRKSPVGIQSFRSQRNIAFPSILEMKFDVTKGVSKITFMYGSTAEDPGCYYRLEYSTDMGITWHSVTGEDIYVDNKTVKTATYMVDFNGKVRFRIYKLGLGSTVVIDNGRLNIDDFAIYRGVD